jgi:peroxiredoxin
MIITQSNPAVSPGDQAPSFSLPAADGSGTISLADYRGKTPLFLALFIGLWCPFCRRALAQLAMTQPALKASGVETLSVVATRPSNAQHYFKFRPTSLRVASDPELTTHREYGVPRPVSTPEFMKDLDLIRINPEGMFPEPLPISQANTAIAQLDGYAENEVDHADMERQWPQLKGQFLIDPDGIVCWTNIECATEGLSGLGNFPSLDEILAAAQTMPRD